MPIGVLSSYDFNLWHYSFLKRHGLLKILVIA